MPDNPTKELLTALSEFQKTTLAAHKDNSTGRFKYATETSINDTIRSAKNSGLAHTFTMAPVGVSEGDTIGQTEVKLRVFHAASGGFLESTMLVADYDPKNTRDIRHQQRGSGISYAKRYLLAAAFGIATEENEGECLAEDIEAEAKAPAKPNAKANTPKQASAPAKPQVDPLEERRAKCKAELGKFYATDKGIVPIWQKHMKNRFNGALKVEEKHLAVAHLVTEEMVAECESWISQYAATAKAQK